MESQLIICSCYYSPESKKLLELNFDFIRRQNPQSVFFGLVANNTRVPFPESNAPFGEDIRIVEGAPWPENQRKWVRGSYHHAAALEKLVPFITTRFVLFLDPDFYIVRRNWIQEITNHMAQNDLSFFGVPWHPRHFKKIRYFPAPHSLFIDLKKIDKKTIKFQPDYDFNRVLPFGVRLVKKILRLFFGKRSKIGIAKDTGYPLYKQYGSDPKIGVECLSPVWNYKPNFFDRILPDKFSYMPKRERYISHKSFHDFGKFDVSGEGWEEFLWKNEPFGFHVRGSKKISTDEGFHTIQNVLKSF